MSKGSSYWGTATGKIGNTVVSVVKGQRIERAHQPNVLNRRTNLQMIQRARFANCVKFYKRAYNNFFQFAYEDKTTTESDYNAFMRHNTSMISALLTKEQVNSQFVALGDGWVLSQGILAEPILSNVRGIQPYLSLPSLVTTADTIGELSKALVSDYSLINGDIVTIVRVTSNVTSIYSAIPSQPAKWDVNQFVVDTNSTRKVEEIRAGLSLLTSRGLYLDYPSVRNPTWYGVVFTRRSTSNILRCSNSKLQGNSYAYQMYLDAQSSTWRDTVLKTWGATGEAVLEGTLVSTSVNAVIDTVNGDSVPRVSNTVFNAGITSSAVLVGANLDLVKITDFVFDGGSVVGYETQGSQQATLTLQGNGDNPTAWTLYFNGKLIARAATAVTTITSVSPSSIDKLDNGDTVNIDIIGTNMTGFNPEGLASTNEALTVANCTIVSNTKATVTLRATDNVTEGTITYNGQNIFEVKVVVVTITSPASGQEEPGGNKTYNLVGTNLTKLTASSFKVTGSAAVVSYNATSDTAAVLVVSTSSGGNGSVSYGDWTQTYQLDIPGGEDIPSV